MIVVGGDFGGLVIIRAAQCFYRGCAKLAWPSQMDITHAHNAKLRSQGGVWAMLLPH